MTEAKRARPKTGEKRKTQQPLKIDRLPPAVHEAILHLYSTEGRTWEEIEELSALPLDESRGKGGFVDWMNLPLAVLELFPEMRLPHSTLHRWFDIRVRQVQGDVLRRAEMSRRIAAVFAQGEVAGSEAAVMNAARDIILGILSEDSSEVGRQNAAKGLLKLAEVQQKARTNDIRERKVSTEESKIQILERREALAIKKLEKETEAVAKKAVRGEVTVEDINRIRERTFGLPPVRKEA